MAAIRALLVFAALAGFFLVGAPLQWLIARHMPRMAHRIPIFFCRSLLRLLSVRVSIDGAAIAAGPVLMAANHVSWIDVLVLGGIQPFCFLAKSEVSRWPILSAFAEVQGTVFVDRARRRSIPGANEMMAKRMAEGHAVLLFPEGTTNAAAEPGPFRTSHFAAARELLRSHRLRETVAVQPVAISYSSRNAAWVGDDGLLSHVWRTLRAPPLECRVTFSTPIAYTRASNRKQVARLSREAIIDALGRSAAPAAAVSSPAAVEAGHLAPKHC